MVFGQAGSDTREEYGCDGPGDKESLDGVADRGTLDFGVQDDGFGHFGIGIRVDVDMTNPLVMYDDRDFGAFGDGTDETFAAPRHTKVDILGEGEQGGNGLTIGCGHDLDGAFGEGWEAAFCGVDHGVGDDLVRMQGFAPALEDGGVAGFEAERGGIRGDVGAGFVDDDDDADWGADFSKFEAVWAGAGIQGSADWVWEGGDFEEALGHGGDTFGIEAEAVEHGGGEAGVFAGLEVKGIGIDDCRLLAENCLRHGREAAVLVGSRQDREESRG